MPEEKQNKQESDFLKRKMERLASALYVVTAVLPESEPIKWKLRQLSLELSSLVSDLYIISDIQNSQLKDQVDIGPIAQKIDELVSLLNIALMSGSVSQMNFALLKQEYQNYKTLLDKMSGKIVWKSYMLSGETGEYIKQLEVGHPKGQNMSNKVGNTNLLNINKSSSRKESPYGTSTEDQAKKVIDRQQVDIIKNERKEKIINFLKGKDWASIKDISGAISGYSVKTVQRELSDLVDQNVLKKKGERRWSRYILNGHSSNGHN